MLELAFIIGIYSYVIFFLGILGFLYQNLIIASSVIYSILVIIYFAKIKKIPLLKFKKIKIDKFSKLILILVLTQALVNLIGALGPEISFDALWYHLTLPKLYLENHFISHIPGGILYYSDMPKNIEMLFVPALSFSNEISAKLIHYIFGLLSLIALYKLSRNFLSQRLSLLACLIFYSNLIVGWQSITAYVDLGRTFFEIAALNEFIKWMDKRKIKYLIFCAVLIGFSLSAKVVALNSILIFILLITLYSFSVKIKFLEFVKNIIYFLFFSIIIPAPWFIFSYLNTGNPIYPLLDPNFSFFQSAGILNLIKLFINSPDPINPIYLITIPLVIFLFKKYDRKLKYLTVYIILALIFWQINSSIGGGRFVLPYLGAFSILSVSAFLYIKNRLFKKYLFIIIILISISSIGYRFLANSKYIPVVLGLQSKEEFLSKNLNFSFGDFYDTDGYFQKNIKSSDTILLYGFHNLYYVNFPFIDSSWVKKGDKFNYIAVQNSIIPARFSNWTQVYYNKQTSVKLYSREGKTWVY